MGRRLTNRAAVAAAVAAALVTGGDGLAFGEAGGGPRVAVLTLPGAQASRQRAEEVAGPIVEALGGGVVGPEQARGVLAPRGEGAAARELRRLTVRARQELEAFEDLDRAAELLDRAAAAHVALLPLLDGVQEPVRLLVEAATVRLAMGDEDGVDRALREAVRLDPALDLDPTELPRRLARSASAAREAGADEPVLAPAVAQGFAVELGAPLLLVVQPRPGPRRVVVELYAGGTGERTGRWVVEDAAVRSAVRAVVEAVDRPGASAPRPAPAAPTALPEGSAAGDEEPPPPPPPGEPWHRRWWVWTLVAVVVAAVAAGATIAAVEAQEPPDVGLEVMRRW